MVIVKNYHRREGEKGEYITLEIEGEMELVQSQNTGRFYATTRRCFIYSTFDAATAQRMIGSQMEGQIVRIPCEPFDYVLPETGETIQIGHRWDYVPEEVPVAKKRIPIGIYEIPRTN